MANLRKEARGRECLIRIPGVCNGNPETVVLCHLPSYGMGIKSSDLCAALGCYDCHSAVDGRVETPYPAETLRRWHYDGMRRTLELWEKEGLISA